MLASMGKLKFQIVRINTLSKEAKKEIKFESLILKASRKH
jgi:hypothetical protein